MDEDGVGTFHPIFDEKLVQGEGKHLLHHYVPYSKVGDIYIYIYRYRYRYQASKFT